jgi:diaminopimelate decarboxylase
MMFWESVPLLKQSADIDPVCRVNPAKYVGKKDLAECLNLTSGGTLAFGGVDVLDFVNEHGTRCYITDLSQVTRKARRIVESFSNYPSKLHPVYAIKANSGRAIVNSIVREGFGLEVTNIHEFFYSLEVLENIGIKDRSPAVICNGVSKHHAQGLNKESLIETAFRHQSRNGLDIIVNLSSMEEVKFAVKVAKLLGGGIRVGIRINPAIKPKTAEDLATGAGYSRFGIPINELENVFREICDEKDSMKLIQLHCHIGSQIPNMETLTGVHAKKGAEGRGVLRVLSSKISELEKKFGVHVEQINIGGGIAVKYVKTKPRDVREYGEFWPDYSIEEYARRITTTLEWIHEENGSTCPQLCVEPGRWITADSTALLLTVTDAFNLQDEYKRSMKGAGKWIITDGSAMTDAHDVVLLKQWFEILNASKINKPLETLYNIGGIACDSGDVFAWGRDRTGPRMLPETSKGDVLTVLDVGAYQQALSSNYNLLPTAPAYDTKGSDITGEKKNSSLR